MHSERNLSNVGDKMASNVYACVWGTILKGGGKFAGKNSFTGRTV